jgi:hypothetical protein
MSYLNNTRVVFSGTFQADVSTVNNDVRHFDTASWESRFQELQKPDGTQDGWWNPVGSGAFRLIGCRVTSVHYRDGARISNPTEDPAVGLVIGGANERVAAKLVDLDPQWQMASQIWGLKIRLTAGTDPAWVEGEFEPSAFRDLTLSRIHSACGDGGGSSIFQSVLKNLVWAKMVEKSRALQELEEIAKSGQLSMRMMTFAYVAKYGDPRFSLGRVCGVIGPAFANEPKTFVLGRRFVAADVSLGHSWNGINYFVAVIDDASSSLLLDLSNALQLSDTNGTVRDIGKLTVGILRDSSLTEKSPVTDANFEILGELDYRAQNWLFEASGICSLRLTARQLDSAKRAPLALAAELPLGPRLVAIRENENGYHSCAEEFVHRIDAPKKSRLTIYAAKYGRPLADANVMLDALPKQSGWGRGLPNAPNQPKASIPDTCVPAEVLAFSPNVKTDKEGRVAIEIDVKSPGNPRKYIDGQIYAISYRIEDESPNAHPKFDLIIIHARDSFVVPTNPSWMPDIAPIFTQYRNLYPIMSQRLIDLTDPESVVGNLKILQLAFSLGISDPNYMPVTRDLSENKRIAIQRWLDRLAVDGDPTFLKEALAPEFKVGETEIPLVNAHSNVDAAEPLGGKTSFARSLEINQQKT